MIKTMYVRKDRPKDIFPKRLSGLMESYEIEKGRRGISNIALRVCSIKSVTVPMMPR